MSYTPKMRASHAKRPMTRRDYELIAAIILYLPPTTCTRQQVAKSFAAALMYLPGFREDRFLKACGVFR